MISPAEARRFNSGERSGVELQQHAELPNGQRIVLPQRDHDEVLRVGEAQRLQHWTVERDDASGSHGQGEAHLSVEGKGIVQVRSVDPACRRSHGASVAN